MNILIINKEISSPALKEVISSLTLTHENILNGNTDYRQANVEISACKHIIQSIALDWAYSGKLKGLRTNKMDKLENNL